MISARIVGFKWIVLWHIKWFSVKSIIDPWNIWQCGDDSTIILYLWWLKYIFCVYFFWLFYMSYMFSCVAGFNFFVMKYMPFWIQDRVVFFAGHAGWNYDYDFLCDFHFYRVLQGAWIFLMISMFSNRCFFMRAFIRHHGKIQVTMPLRRA